MAILVVSSEMEEVMGIADRILVMSEGAIMGELTRSQFSEHAIMSMASPHSRDAA
jgi:L-arabinose transport system ATP-binding protein